MVIVACCVVGIIALRCAEGCKICCIVSSIDIVVLAIVADKHTQVAQIHITASTDIGLEEIDAASTIVTNAVHPDCEIIWGANFDEELEDEMIITVIATRFGDEGPNHQIKSTTANLEVAPPVTEPVAPTTAAPSAFTNSDDDAFDQIVDFFKK